MESDLRTGAEKATASAVPVAQSRAWEAKP